MTKKQNDQDLMQQLQDLQAQYEEKAKKIGKPAFVELATPLFECCPELEAIVWTQYTPHFNDGGACTFSINLYDGFYSKKAVEEAGEDFDYDDGDIDGYGNDAHKLTAAQKKVFKSFEDFLTGTIGEDLAERVFGDGVKVTLWRDGKIDVDDYDHD